MRRFLQIPWSQDGSIFHLCLGLTVNSTNTVLSYNGQSFPRLPTFDPRQPKSYSVNPMQVSGPQVLEFGCPWCRSTVSMAVVVNPGFNRSNIDFMGFVICLFRLAVLCWMPFLTQPSVTPYNPLIWALDRFKKTSAFDPPTLHFITHYNTTTFLSF